ncbi:hypothetical protein ABTY00_38030 [Streptomyces microflavus]|uniref:hypothetical protein n=1 Tax=Streptomyces microflavus TaxID=1919 RepID=UPI003331AF93
MDGSLDGRGSGSAGELLPDPGALLFGDSCVRGGRGEAEEAVQLAFLSVGFAGTAIEVIMVFYAVVIRFFS